jgi:hypothetical protein
MSTNKPLPKPFLEAIDSANIDRLRSTLEQVCRKVPEALRVASEELLNQILTTANNPNPNPNEVSAPPLTDQQLVKNAVAEYNFVTNILHAGMEEQKRKRSDLPVDKRRYATCENCEKEFDVTKNGPKACRYHPGRLNFVFFSHSLFNDVNLNIACG